MCPAQRLFVAISVPEMQVQLLGMGRRASTRAHALHEGFRPRQRLLCVLTEFAVDAGAGEQRVP